MKKNIFFRILSVLIITSLILTSCGKNSMIVKDESDKYRNFYEIFVHSFYDSNDDGVGDLNGIVKKIDYLKDGSDKSLNIDGIWLMPIMPSPTYHKYDVTDYYGIDASYGTMENFEALSKLCKERGIMLIIDLVLNHSSAQHPWFKSAVKSLAIEPCGAEQCTVADLCREHNPYCDFYVFTQDPAGQKGYYNLGMPKGWYYQAVFWDQMPDLNLDNENLRDEILKITQFWFDKGVSGFRLDAVTQFYNENTSTNTQFLKWFNKGVKTQNPNAYIVAEAWTDGGTIKQYYESGIDSLFNFPFADSNGKIVNTIRNKTGSSLSEYIESWQKEILEINPLAIDAPFLSNHDNARSAGFLMNNLTQQKMAANIYQLMPGNSFIYYGEEIGMTGSGKDENKRQPMVWSVTDKKGIPYPVTGTEQTQDLSEGVSEQLKNKDSLLNHYISLIALKNSYPEISKGKVTSVKVSDASYNLCIYETVYEDSKIYVIHNISLDENELVFPASIYGYEKTIASFTTDGAEITQKGDTIIMPPFSTIILK